MKARLQIMLLVDVGQRVLTLVSPVSSVTRLVAPLAPSGVRTDDHAGGACPG